MSRLCLLFFLLFAALTYFTSMVQAGFFDKDEEIVFFPTYGYRSPDHQSWNLLIHGWIFSPERDSKKRKILLAILRRSLHLPKEDERNNLFQKRARFFLTDNERGRTTTIRVGDKEFVLKASTSDGHFRDWITVPLTQAQAGSWLSFETSASPENSRVFHGQVQLLEDTGVSIISDIDDTIKLTDIGNRRALLQNTFLLPYQDIPGMANLYRHWAESGAMFHYISGTPWQLASELSEFMQLTRFPPGSFHLRSFRFKDRSLFELFHSPEVYKPSVIKDLIDRLPHRRFILVGDSGEKDPEIYAAIYREHPDSISHIFIRDLASSMHSDRFRAAFHGIPESRWTVFSDVEKLRDVPL